MTLFFALVIGIVAGLRAMTAPAAVAWGAALGWLPLGGTWAAVLGFRFTPWIFTLLALGEFAADKLPTTPSRKVPVQFGTRLVSGGFCGAVLATPSGSPILGLVGGVIGAVIGTLGGAEARGRLVAAIGGNDRPIAFLEDAVAIVLGLIAVSAVA